MKNRFKKPSPHTQKLAWYNLRQGRGDASLKRMTPQELGLQARRLAAFNRAKAAQQMFEQGHGVKQIANHFGVSTRTIGRDLKKDVAKEKTNE